MEIRKVASPSLPLPSSLPPSLPPFLYSRLCSSKSEISVRAVAPLTKFRRPENSAGKVNGLARIPTRVTLGPSCRETVPPKQRRTSHFGAVLFSPGRRRDRIYRITFRKRFEPIKFVVSLAVTGLEFNCPPPNFP